MTKDLSWPPLGLFSDDPDDFRVGGLFLRMVAPLYLCFGMGHGLFFISVSRP